MYDIFVQLMLMGLIVLGIITAASWTFDLAFPPICNHKNMEKSVKAFQEMCEKHEGKINSASLEWEKVKTGFPKRESYVPLIIVDFK